MILFYFILFIFSFSDSAYVSKTEKQVIDYVENLKSEKNVALNSWALNEIATLNCKGLEIVQRHISSIPEQNDYYKNLDCSKLNEPNKNKNGLFFWDEETKKFYAHIRKIEGKIDSSIQGYDEYLFIHFLNLMGSKPTKLYTREYLNKALESWVNYKLVLHKDERLKHSILTSLIIRVGYILDEYGTIEDQYDDFLSQELLPNSLYKLRLLGAFDYTFYVYGNFDKSLKLQRQHSLPLAEFIGSKREVQSIKNRQGAYLISLGKFEESKKIYEELYNDSLAIEDQYSVFTNLGVSYSRLGYSNKYISFQLKAIEEDVSNYKSLLSIYRNLFLYYTSVKDINSALKYIDKAKLVAASNNDSTELALIDSYLGTFYWTNYRDPITALKFLDKAEGVLSPDKEFSRYVDLLIEKGSILVSIDSLNLAKSIFNDVMELSLSKSNTTNYSDALINLAGIHLKQKNYALARQNLEEIKLYSLENLDFPLLTKYFTIKAEYLQKTGKKRLAINELLPVINQVIDRTGNATDSQEGYWFIEEEYLDAFEFMIELFISNNEPEEALTLLDRLKTINDATLYNSPLVKAAKLSEEELAEEKRLNQKLQSLRKKYLNANEDERFEINKEIDLTSAEREEILTSANLEKNEALPPIWSIQRSLNENELLLHFTELGNKLYVGYLTSSNIQIKRFDFDKERQELFAMIGDELASGRTNLNDLHHLYQILDLDTIPEHISQISVIPDNYLYRIPLEVLPTQKPDSPISYGGAKYFIEDYYFRYFTSLKEFDSNRRIFSTETESDFTGFAVSDFKAFSGTNLPSLPYATVETNNISNVLTSLNNKKIYTGDAATKAIFKEKVGSSRLVHVATHSEVSEQDPLFSTIYLKNSDLVNSDTLQSEQALYAYELFNTPLNSEFIMLNSCSSGSGNYIQGSGIMGISRALRYAGAKSLALNLWSVNDKVASEFATDFYNYLNKGETKSEAIRMAKLDQLKKANANPHFWGAYMMIGNPSPITNKTSNSTLLFSMLVVTIFLTGFATYRKEAA